MKKAKVAVLTLASLLAVGGLTGCSIQKEVTVAELNLQWLPKKAYQKAAVTVGEGEDAKKFETYAYSNEQLTFTIWQKPGLFFLNYWQFQDHKIKDDVSIKPYVVDIKLDGLTEELELTKKYYIKVNGRVMGEYDPNGTETKIGIDRVPFAFAPVIKLVTKK